MKKNNMYQIDKFNYIIKTGFIVVFIWMQITSVQAQTEPMYSQYMFSMLNVNPAYAGSRESVGFNIIQRNQWIGLEGAPQTTSVSIDGPANQKRIGWGMQVYNDKIGVENATGLNSMFATRIKVSEEGILSAGISMGLMNYKIDLISLSDRLYQNNDPAYFSNMNKFMPIIGTGVFYNTDRFYVGLSIPSIFKSKITELYLIESGIQKMNKNHLFFNAGYVFALNDDIKIKPSTMLKIVDGAPLQFDLNTNFWLKDMLGLGVSYRNKDAIVGLAELQITPSLRIGYAYDKTISKLKYYNNGSHEILLRYEIMNKIYKIKSTRHF